MKQKNKKEDFQECYYNPGHNILELYNILVQVQFVTSKTKLYIQYRKLGIALASRVANHLRLRILGSQEIFKPAGLHNKISRRSLLKLNQSFYHAKLQGPAPFKDNPKNVPFVTTYYENIDNEKVVRKIRSKLSNIQLRLVSELFKNKNVVISQKQPKNLLRLLTRAGFNTEINAFQKQNSLFKYIDKRCKIYSLYIVEGHSFIMPNNMRWELRSHVTCRSINMIYYLKCNMR